MSFQLCSVWAWALTRTSGASATVLACDVREDPVLRFLASSPSASRRVSLETGTAEIEMGAEGLEFETRFAHVWTIRDGFLSGLDNYLDTATVLAALAGRTLPKPA